MFVSMKASKKRIIAILILTAAVVGAVLYLRWDRGEATEPKQFFGETNEERIAFLQSFGWQTEASPAETREVMIPAQFDDVYQNYNAMQQAQGFDLAPYAGEIVTQFKYKITNYPGETEVFATLLVYGRLIVGGDLACAEASGFMHGFAPDSARYGEATPQPGAPAESGTASGAEGGTESLPESSGAVSSADSESQAESQSTAGGESALTSEESSTEGAGVSSEAADAQPEWPTD